MKYKPILLAIYLTTSSKRWGAGDVRDSGGGGCADGNNTRCCRGAGADAVVDDALVVDAAIYSASYVRMRAQRLEYEPFSLRRLCRRLHSMWLLL